jgi:N-methylhydantoinase B
LVVGRDLLGAETPDGALQEVEGAVFDLDYEGFVSAMNTGAPKSPDRSPDPIRLEVIRNRLTAVADEMGLALQRAAYSTNIKTRLDFSCAIFDRSARVIAQSFSQPNHLGSLAHFVPQIVSTYGREKLVEGDGILCNDGHLGGVHLNDVCLLSPLFHEGDLVAFVATLAHQVDVGGGTPGSLTGLSREIYGEGLRIPPVRFLRNGRIVDDIFNLVANNIRSPKETGGDLRAQIAGVHVGLRRLEEVIEKFGWETLSTSIENLLAYTERRVRDEVARIPDGEYRAVGWMDDDGIHDEPIRVEVGVTVRGEKVTFDLSGSDAQREAPVNATFAMTLSSCAYALRTLMGSDVVVNDGFYRVLEVVAPPGTVANAQSPAAIGGGWEMAFRICETALQAFAEVVPDRLCAGSKGCICNIAFGGRGRDGAPYVFYEAMGGGYGARATKDGIDAIQPHVQNTENSPVEETEVSYPVRIVRYELVADSEGAGRYRGGLGLRRDYEFERPSTFSVLADRAKFPPWGLCGGLPAAPAEYVLISQGDERSLPSKTSVELAPGDVFSVRTAGGGGYGSPWERDPDRVLADVLEGRISADRAREVYGVAVDLDDRTIDEQETGALRRGLSESQADAGRSRA